MKIGNFHKSDVDRALGFRAAQLKVRSTCKLRCSCFDTAKGGGGGGRTKVAALRKEEQGEQGSRFPARLKKLLYSKGGNARRGISI